MINRKNNASSMQRQSVAQHAQKTDAFSFFNLLTSPELLDTVETLLPEHRERLYPPTMTLSLFLSQVLNPDSSCQRAVNEFAIQRQFAGLAPCGISTGGFCKARQRLPIELVTKLAQTIGAMVSHRSRPDWRWYGRRVKLVDGTTVSMPDTAANQAVFPQQTGQQAGVGFPLARMVSVLCYSTGVVLDAAIGPFKGKGASEHALFRQLIERLEPRDLIVADRYYSSYFTIAKLLEAGIDVVFQQHGVRKTDFRQGRCLGSQDHLVEWEKPKSKPPWMTQSDYEQVAERITIREFLHNGKVIITTLPPASGIPPKAIAALYRERWHVELDLRNLKTTLGMDTLRCKTPEMATKEIWAYFLAYNLIRLLMAQAAYQSGAEPRDLSFKHSVQVWVIWSQGQFIHEKEEDLTSLFSLIATVRVGQRAGRIEPRALKRRPKPYPLMTKPREVMREEIRKNGHPRKLK